MDIKVLAGRITAFLKKFRYVVLVLVIGLILMMIPGGDKGEEQPVEAPVAEQKPQTSINETLADILSQIEGAGKVQVLLTVAAGEETIYQTDDDVTVTDDSNATQIDTVIITDAQRNQTGLIRQVNPPAYQGAIIVCQGADSPAVQLAIVNAVSRVTGLGADRISVLKMK